MENQPIQAKILNCHNLGVIYYCSFQESVWPLRFPIKMLPTRIAACMNANKWPLASGGLTMSRHSSASSMRPATRSQLTVMAALLARKLVPVRKPSKYKEKKGQVTVFLLSLP